MSKKRKSLLIVGTVIILLVVGLAYLIIKTKLTNYATPLSSCVECDIKFSSPWGWKTCCISYISDALCKIRGGVLVFHDLHPVWGQGVECYRKAPDAGKACASHNDCLVRCNLDDAITSNRCKLVNKEITGKGVWGQEFYVATYSCITDKPGRCAEAPAGGINPGGRTRTLKMDGYNLIEEVRSGPIY